MTLRPSRWIELTRRVRARAPLNVRPAWLSSSAGLRKSPIHRSPPGREASCFSPDAFHRSASVLIRRGHSSLALERVMRSRSFFKLAPVRALRHCLGMDLGTPLLSGDSGPPERSPYDLSTGRITPRHLEWRAPGTAS